MPRPVGNARPSSNDSAASGAAGWWMDDGPPTDPDLDDGRAPGPVPVPPAGRPPEPARPAPSWSRSGTTHRTRDLATTWQAVVTELGEDLGESYSRADISSEAERALRDLRGSISAEALPEMVIRLVRVRLLTRGSSTDAPPAEDGAPAPEPLPPRTTRRTHSHRRRSTRKNQPRRMRLRIRG